MKNYLVSLEKRLSTFDKDKQRIEKLSFEELQDLNELLRLADYILTKHEDKKEVYALLKDFVGMINNSSNSMDLLNDKITRVSGLCRRVYFTHQKPPK